MRKQLQAILEKIAEELPGYQTAALVNVDDGLTVAEYSTNPAMNTEAAAAYLASIVKSNSKAINLLTGNQQTEDIMVTTDQFYYLIRDLPNQPVFLFLMTKRGEWLGKARMLLLESMPQLTEILTEYFAPGQE